MHDEHFCLRTHRRALSLAESTLSPAITHEGLCVLTRVVYRSSMRQGWWTPSSGRLEMTCARALSSPG